MKDDPTKPVKAIYAGLVALLGTLGVAVAKAIAPRVVTIASPRCWPSAARTA